VSTLIHLYSIGYMSHDEHFPKFFLYLNLFVSSMLILVLAGNFLLSFLGWEGVGVCSYFLIAFWFDRPSAASAGKKAMIFNRIGDAGFLLAMFLIYERTGSLQFGIVFSRLGGVGTTSLTAIALLLFLGAAG
jgi:NADH-quinone oxidoreductase subunit L